MIDILNKYDYLFDVILLNKLKFYNILTAETIDGLF